MKGKSTSLSEDDQINQGLDLIQQGFSIFDAEMRLVKCNRRFVIMYDLPEALASRGATFKEINLYLARRGEYGPGDPEELVRTRVELAMRFEPHYIERTRPDGKRFAIEGHPLRQGGWVTIYSDITESWKQDRVLKARSDLLSDKLLMHNEEQTRINRELVAANRALQEAKANLQFSEARTRTITNALPAHIAYVDRHYTYRFSNNRLDDIMDLRVANVVGRQVSDVFPRETYLVLKEKIDEAFTGKTVTAEYVVNAGEPHAQSIRTTLSPELGPDGDVVGAFVLSINVSVEKAATQMQLRAKRMETTAQLTSGLAHDFSNMLTIILGNLHRMSKGATAIQLELMRSTERAAKRGTRIIDNLMSLLYRHQLDAREANISNVLRDLVPLFSSLNTNIHFDLQLPEQDIFATVDEGAIQDVVLNMLFNSKDAIESSSNAGSIALCATITGSSIGCEELLQIIVTDSGDGFSEQALALGSEPFFSTKPQGKGSGLGLSMVRSIAEQLCGTLQYVNVPDGGAKVTFTVPLNPRPEQKQHRDLSTATDGFAESGKPLVLIVDDSAEIRTLLREHVVQMGLLAVEAEQVDEAITLLDQLEDVDIVISDIVMPGRRNGMDLALLLEKTRPELSVLLVSGLPADSDLLKSASSRFTVLPKPIDPALFESNLVNMIGAQANREHP